MSEVQDLGCFEHSPMLILYFQFLETYQNAQEEKCREHETCINTDLNVFYRETDVSICKLILF